MQSSALARPTLPFLGKGGFRTLVLWALLERPMYADPLRKHDCAPVTDGAAAIVLAADDKAREVAERPAALRGAAGDANEADLGLAVPVSSTLDHDHLPGSVRGTRRPVAAAAT